MMCVNHALRKMESSPYPNPTQTNPPIFFCVYVSYRLGSLRNDRPASDDWECKHEWLIYFFTLSIIFFFFFFRAIDACIIYDAWKRNKKKSLHVLHHEKISACKPFSSRNPTVIWCTGIESISNITSATIAWKLTLYYYSLVLLLDALAALSILHNEYIIQFRPWRPSIPAFEHRLWRPSWRANNFCLRRPPWTCFWRRFIQIILWTVPQRWIGLWSPSWWGFCGVQRSGNPRQ